MPITTVAACKAFRGIESHVIEHDDELTRLIPAVQAWLEGECGRLFDRATVTEYLDGDAWRDVLYVDRPPIASITNIWDDASRVFDTPLDATAYEFSTGDDGLVRLLDGRCFSVGRRTIKITYVGGYQTMPTDLEQAAIEMVWAAREKGVNNLIGVRNRSVADGNVQWLNLDWGSLNLQPVILKYRIRTGLG